MAKITLRRRTGTPSQTMFYGNDHSIMFRSGGNVTAAILLSCGNAAFDGSISAAASFYEQSGACLKPQTKDVWDTRSIQARTYYKNDKLETGYFAQDVQQIMPHTVKEEADGYLILNYTQVLVNKVANLEEDVKQLQIN